MSASKFARFDSGPISENSSRSDEMDLDEAPRVLRIAVDFGTTFSSVAYSLTPKSDYLTRLVDVACIARYPGDKPIPMITHQWEPRQDVPTELLYSEVLAKSRAHQANTVRNVDDDILEHGSLSGSDASSAFSVESFERERSPDARPISSQTEKQTQSKSIAWGFEVQQQLANDDALINTEQHISRFKLLLDNPREESVEIQNIRLTNTKKLKKLKRQKRIASDAEVVTHFLEKLFFHVKIELEHAGRWDPAMDIEFVLCVPAVWPSKACRIMQNSMANAIRSSGLGILKDNQLDNLFIVSEPEAAATCIMAEQENGILAGETIVIIDAGGGTVDAVTYDITHTNPLRISSEIVPPKTEPCGGSYINERYAQFLLEKLRNETYLEKNGKTIQGIITREVIRFENTAKRVLDLNDPSCDVESIYINDLRPSPTDSQLQQNRIMINERDVKRIFKHSLKGTAAVLNDQLELAKAKGRSVQKVLLTGGFGQSPFLQSHLRRILRRQGNFSLDGGEIPLVVPKAASTAVARGAVLRASNKELGPDRVSSCSYGFLRSEPFEPEIYPAHLHTTPRVDPIDGEQYIHHTIDWLFKKDDVLKVGAQKLITVTHTFASTKKNLICREVLYVSDERKESHYRKTHSKNKGAEEAGSITVDMTSLRDRGLIQLEPVSEHSVFYGKDKKVWVVEYELVLIVDGRNLVFEARWPVLKPQPSRSDRLSQISNQQQQVYATSQVCIAATFKPGTA